MPFQRQLQEGSGLEAVAMLRERDLREPFDGPSKALKIMAFIVDLQSRFRVQRVAE